METYNQITAHHYAAYRPPLHQIILEKCIQSQSFRLGLDIGCGVGHSAVALSAFCEKVIGLEPSQAMLSDAVAHSKVVYHFYAQQRFDFEANTFDIITFAGSLFYAKSQHMLDEVIRVSQQKASVLIYDFQIDLNPILADLGISCSFDEICDYNHEVNFDGLEWKDAIFLQSSHKEILTLSIEHTNVVHLLLSDSSFYQLLEKQFGINDLATRLHFRLKEMDKQGYKRIQATLYYTIYEVMKTT